MTGVYAWVNTVTGKRLVGSTSRCLEKRRKEYLRRLAKGTCHNQHFQRAWNKYGAAAFVWDVIEHCAPKQCLTRETLWIRFYSATDDRYGYNICEHGRSHLGTRLTEEHKRKIGEANAVSLLGNKQSAETRTKRAAALRGITRSEATRAKMSDAALGHWRDPVVRQKRIDGIKRAIQRKRGSHALVPGW